MKGTTLIETLIYIALLSVLMIGIFSSVHTVIDSAKREEMQSEKDAALLLKKYYE